MYSKSDRRFLVAAFFLTGISGLVFQIVWTRLLVLSFGYTTYSVSTVVATFMGGLALGGWVGGVLADRVRRLPLTYAVLEVVAGGLGVVATLALLRFPEFVASARQFLDIPYHGFSPWIALASLMVLLPPTVLMGATLPVLAKAVTRSQGTGGWDISPLYAFNTLGAAVGAALAGFVALALLGVTQTALAAAVLNLLVGAAVALRFHSRDNPAPAAAAVKSGFTWWSPLSSPVAVGFGISGFAALSAEVAWTRILAPFLEGSVYAFSLVICVFLVGIASGSLAGRHWSQQSDDMERGFGIALLGVGLSTLVGVILLYPFIGEHSEILRDLGVIVRKPDVLLESALWFFLILAPSTFFMGVGFPFVARWASSNMVALGRRTGSVYALNTIAGVLGSVFAGFLLIPLIGVKQTLILSSVLYLVTGAVLMYRRITVSRDRLAFTGLAVVLGLGVLLTHRLSEPGLFATSLGYPNQEVIWHREDPDAAVTYLRDAHGEQLNIGLRPVSGTSLALTPWMTHLPMLYTGKAENNKVLNIGLGVGHTYDVALAYPGSRVTVVELVGGVVEVFRRFRPNARQLMANPRGRVVLGDGRNYLLDQPDNEFDVIIVDPTPPLYGAGAVNLYTADFFRLCADKLTRDGRLMMRLPFSADPSSVKLVMRSAVEVFGHISLWQQSQGSGYSLIASPGMLEEPTDQQLVQRFRDAAWVSEEHRQFLERVRPRQVGERAELAALVADVPLVTDEHPYLEHPIYFPLWMSP